MKLDKDVVRELRVEPGQPGRLRGRSTSETRHDWLGALGHSDPREVADRDLDSWKAQLEEAQGRLYAADRWALLIVFQALDAAGKDGTISHVMSGVDPQGCQVASFKQPSELELRHDFLWRCTTALPERGRIGIFNRSYYEDVLVVRVHPELLGARHLPPGPKIGARLWRERSEDINAFERHLSRNGTKIVKFFLHVSREEQRRRLLARLEDPAKQWKFSPSDVPEHSFYAAYQKVYEEVLTATSTTWAPWYVIPADHKHAMRALVAGIVVAAIDDLGLQTPPLSLEQRAGLAAARAELTGERRASEASPRERERARASRRPVASPTPPASSRSADRRDRG
jgi:PPK2 family polyphosphate:nucleotide phosphotransferase